MQNVINTINTFIKTIFNIGVDNTITSIFPFLFNYYFKFSRFLNSFYRDFGHFYNLEVCVPEFKQIWNEMIQIKILSGS